MFPSNFPDGLRVLVFDEDPAYLLKLETHLQEFQYKVTICNEEEKAMHLLCNHRNRFDIAIIQVNNSDGDRFRFLSEIRLETDLPIIIISKDESRESIVKWMTNGASDYLVKPIRPEDLRMIFKHVVKKLRGRSVVTDEPEEKPSGEKSSSVGDSTIRNPKKRKANEEDHHDHDRSTQRKKRVVWDPELHKTFVKAVEFLGPGNAVPKKILEIMNVEHITRENVASHLQKFRIQKEKDKIKSEEANISLIPPQERRVHVGRENASYFYSGRNVQVPTHHINNIPPQPSYVQQHTTNVPYNLTTHLIPPLEHRFDGVSIAVSSTNLMMTHQYHHHLHTSDFTTEDNLGYNNISEEVANLCLTPTSEHLDFPFQDYASTEMGNVQETVPSPMFHLPSNSSSYTHSSFVDQRENGGFSCNSGYM